MKCSKCDNETGKLIDGVPVCKDCMLKDAAGNRGRVIDYSKKMPDTLQEAIDYVNKNPPVMPEYALRQSKKQARKKRK